MPPPGSGSAKNSEHCPFVVEGQDVTIPVPGKQPRLSTVGSYKPPPYSNSDVVSPPLNRELVSSER
jgi:hypothetical protein